MFKKISLSVALTLAMVAAHAADYYIVVPLKGLALNFEKNAAVTLSDYAFPPGKVNAAYTPFDLSSLAQVTGDPRYSADKLTWEVVSGSLPSGLTIDALGVLAGTPTVKNTSGNSFELKASYLSKSGQRVYTIVINGETLDVTQIAAAGDHSCVVTTAGGLKCWGLNTHGQLGDGTRTSSLSPVNVTGLSNGVKKVSVSSSHSCAVLDSGAAKCWGYNYSNMLGAKLGDASYTTPQQVYGVTSGAIDISARASHSCVVLSTGAVKCWGDNYSGQLGNGTSGGTGGYGPDLVVGLIDATKVEVGGSRTCALTSAGALKCWGTGTGYASNTPVTIPGMENGVADFGQGMNHACAVTTAGAAKCWGWNYFGELGIGSTPMYTLHANPTQVVGLNTGVVSLSMWDYSTCAVLNNGQVKCWGYNGYGQLGTGNLIDSTTPVAVVGISNATSVSVGDYYACAVTSGNETYCWGRNNSGQLGNGNKTNQSAPQKIVAGP